MLLIYGRCLWPAAVDRCILRVLAESYMAWLRKWFVVELTMVKLQVYNMLTDSVTMVERLNQYMLMTSYDNEICKI